MSARRIAVPAREGRGVASRPGSRSAWSTRAVARSATCSRSAPMTSPSTTAPSTRGCTSSRLFPRPGEHVRDQPPAADPHAGGRRLARHPRHAVRSVRPGALRGPRRGGLARVVPGEPAHGDGRARPSGCRGAPADQPVHEHPGATGRHDRLGAGADAVGDSVTFRTELDCYVVLSACPQDLVPINRDAPGPLELHVAG